MKRQIAYLLLMWAILSAMPARAQTDSLFQFQNALNDSISSFSVDNLQEIYLINTGNQLIKYGMNGDSVGVYNKLTRYGKLSYVEAQNPWKVLLFYKNFSTIVMLDKYLHELGSINLPAKNLYGVQAITTSYDNHIWIYDEQDGKIKKINSEGQVLMSSSDLRQVFSEAPVPSQLIDRDGLLYLYDPGQGLYIFDYYGSFKRKIAMKDCYSIAVVGKAIYGFTKNELLKYTGPAPDWDSYPLPTKLRDSKKVELAGHKMYVLKGNVLSVYSMKE